MGSVPIGLRARLIVEH